MTLAGTASATASNDTITGTGTAFSNALRVGYAADRQQPGGGHADRVGCLAAPGGSLSPGNSLTNVTAYLVPRFDVDFHAGDEIKPSSHVGGAAEAG